MCRGCRLGTDGCWPGGRLSSVVDWRLSGLFFWGHFAAADVRGCWPRVIKQSVPAAISVQIIDDLHSSLLRKMPSPCTSSATGLIH